jgi:MYXO-CTERM domain-containing protein
MTQAAAGLYLLGSSLERFEVGLSEDQGSTAKPVLTLGPAIQGPPICGFGTAETRRCLEQWPTACIGLYACSESDAGVPPDAGTDAGPKSRSPTRDPGGCGCRAAGGRTPSSGTLAFTLALALLVARRRHRA